MTWKRSPFDWPFVNGNHRHSFTKVSVKRKFDVYFDVNRKTVELPVVWYVIMWRHHFDVMDPFVACPVYLIVVIAIFPNVFAIDHFNHVTSSGQNLIGMRPWSVTFDPLPWFNPDITFSRCGISIILIVIDTLTCRKRMSAFGYFRKKKLFLVPDGKSSLLRFTQTYPYLYRRSIDHWQK